jgi:lipopolysaccharide assembly outer membrane protein LptD (OstA)
MLCCPTLNFAPAFAQNRPDLESSNNGAEQIRTEIPLDGNKLIIVSDRQESLGEGRYRAAGNVAITFLDMTITCNEVEYSRKTLQISTKGETAFRQPRISLTGSAVELDSVTKTVTIHNASGYFYDTAGRSDREFFLTGGMSQKIKAEKLEIHWGSEKKE